MRKRLVRWLAACLAAALCIPLTVQAARYTAPVGQVEASAEIEQMFDSVLLADTKTNTVLFEKEAEKAFTPTGGAVSLMTAYIVMQEADWEQEIPIIDAVNDLSANVRKLDLIPGKRWLIKDLTAGMLLHGAQDASLVLCDHISGSQEDFVTLMNQYAKTLGMEHTTYKNPLGAYASGQTTTVSDLLILARAVLENDTLRELLAKSSYDTVNGKTIKNRMEIMQEGRSSYDERIQGLGAGATSSAGTNMLLYAVENGRALLLIAYSEIDDQQMGEKSAKSVLDFFWNAYKLVDVSGVVSALVQGTPIIADDGSQITLGVDAAACSLLAEKEMAQTIEQGGADGFTVSELPAISVAPAPGEPVGTVLLRYQEQDALEVTLTAAEVIPPEAGEAPEEPSVQPQKEPVQIPVYSAEDWAGDTREKTFTDKYGFWIIIIGTVLLAGIVLITAGALRRKKH